MNNEQKHVKRDFEDLKRMRDELRLQAHLAKADLRDAVARLEERWPEVEAGVERMEKATGHAVNELAKAAKEMVSDLRKAYRKHLGDSAEKRT